MDETAFNEMILKSYKTGSRHVCNPPVIGTDDDTVLLMNGYYDYETALVKDGWEPCGEYNKDENFVAYRKGDQNYIMTEDPDYFNKYVIATDAARALNLLNKEDRIRLFEAVINSKGGREGDAALRLPMIGHQIVLENQVFRVQEWQLEGRIEVGPQVIEDRGGWFRFVGGGRR